MELVTGKGKMGLGSLYLFFSSHFPPPLPPLHLSPKETFPPISIHQSMLTMEKSGGLEQQFKVVEDRSDLQCCSGSQSGWTLYLDQSQSLHPRTSSSVHQEEEDEVDETEEDETEEDLSMLSDASSGPPHAHDDEENYSSSCSDEGDGFLPLTRLPEHENKRRRVEEEKHSGDSAASTLSSISKENTSNSKKSAFLMEDEHSSFSATHF